MALECAHLYYTFFSFFVQNEIIAGFGKGGGGREGGKDLENFIALANERPSLSSPSPHGHLQEFEGGFPVLEGSVELFGSIFRYQSCLNMLDMTCQFLIGLLLRQQGWGGGGEGEDSVHSALKSLLMCCFCDDINVSLIGIQSVISLLSYWKGVTLGAGRGVGAWGGEEGGGGRGRLVGHFLCLWRWIGMIGRRLWGFLHPRYEDSHSHVSGLLVQLEVFFFSKSLIKQPSPAHFLFFPLK